MGRRGSHRALRSRFPPPAWYLISASIITTCERRALASQPNQIMASKCTQPARGGGGRGALVGWGGWRQIWAASNSQRSAGDACAGHARSLYSGSSERGNAIVKAVLLSPILVQYPPRSIQTALSSARLLGGGVSLFPSRLCKTPKDRQQRRCSQKPSRCFFEWSAATEDWTRFMEGL